LGLSLCLCGSCSDPVPHGVLHLDPRLEDGRSSAAVLGSTEVAWVHSLETPRADSDFGDWSPRYARIEASPAGAGAFFIADVPEESKFRRVELRFAHTLRADQVDLLELDLGRTTRGMARVTWRNSQDGSGTPFADALVPTLPERGTIRISLGDHPGWTGEITELTLIPKQDGKQRFDFFGVRIGRAGFVMGDDPLEDGGDGGLIARGRQARRAWPSDWNVPLVCDLRVPAQGVLSVDTALAALARAYAESVTFAIDVRAQGGAWETAAQRSFVPREELDALGWKPWHVDLGRWQGRDVRLRLRAFQAGADGTGGALSRAALYWGAPMVIGRLRGKARPNVLLVTLDTTRADAVGPRADGGSDTPFLDRLAREGIRFEDAWTACNSTSPSHASILTGLAVQDHGVMDNRSILDADNRALAESFRAAGYHTAAAVSVEHLQAGKSGLGQGFDQFLRAETDSSNDGGITVSAVQQWLGEWEAAGERPFFLWVHLFDAHTPYGPPQAFLDEFQRRPGIERPGRLSSPATLPATRWGAPGKFLEHVTSRAWPEFLYRASVAYTDACVARLAETLAAAGWYADTAVCVVADHGEALGEHDNWYHHTGVYAEVMRVPLVLRLPGVAGGRVVSAPAWTLDIAPTLCAFANIPGPTEARGVDLLGIAREAPRRVWFEHSDLHQVGCADERYTLIKTLVDYEQWGRERAIPKGTLELYDRARDAGQLHDSSGDRTAEVARYQAEIDRWRASALERRSRRGDLTPEDEAELNRLGY
jgi:arylsulfatase A-like enzyme